MITSNKKLIKNFREILAASINAKGLISAEMDKVDAKYAALAEKEKAEYAKQAKALDAQIEMCNDFLHGADTSKPEPEEPKAEEPTPKSEPETVVDTLFDDNNELEEPAAEEEPAEEPVEDLPNLDAQEDTDWDNLMSDGKMSTVEPESSIDTDDGFPEMPEEWK